MKSAVVIGAGPAGCCAAVLLARLGVRVTLIEKKAFPRVKVCGEFVSPAGTEALERVVSPGQLVEAGARRVSLMALERGDRAVEWETPRPAWCLSRRALDELLRDRAVGAGVVVRQPVGVRRVEYRADDVRVSLSDGGAVVADAAVHADGAGRHDPAGPTPTADGIVGFKCHYRPADAVHGVRIRSCAGAYVGTVGVEGGLATCALVAHKRVVARAGGDADAFVEELWPGWDRERRESPWLSCGVARSPYTEPGHARSVRLGNAAAAVDPVGGEGIGLAVWSAGAFADAFERTGDLMLAKRTLASAYRRRLRVRRWACRGAAEALMRPAVISAAWPLIAAGGDGPGVMGAWYRLSGKPG